MKSKNASTINTTKLQSYLTIAINHKILILLTSFSYSKPHMCTVQYKLEL